VNKWLSVSRRDLLLAGAAAVLAISPRGLWADEVANSAETKKKYEEIVGKAIEYLKVKGQAEDGSFSSFAGIGPTVLATTGMLRHGRTTTDPTVAKAMAYLEKAVQKDGGIYGKGSRFKNYETCVAVMCFKEANKDGKYDDVIAGADKYLQSLQYDEKNKIESSDFNYGGGGYGEGGRPDLSNTGFLIDALKASGNASDDQAIQKALIFVSRCQNLETEHNTTPLAAKVNDGGFYYAITAGGEGRGTEDGGLRSYGSMTYVGLKSLIYAGLKPDDKRVQAATKWISKHYTVEENPNMADAGLYYYYHTFAKCLDALGQDEITDDKGVKHNWRAELIDALAKRQQPDGSWVNKNNRWLEGNANLVTGFALLALSYAKPKS
jgi:squalene-hopene/tetraprenyl-beta-curcumene cyclase